jgi:hypothetical protein
LNSEPDEMPGVVRFGAGVLALTGLFTAALAWKWSRIPGRSRKAHRRRAVSYALYSALCFLMLTVLVVRRWDYLV